MTKARLPNKPHFSQTVQEACIKTDRTPVFLVVKIDETQNNFMKVDQRRITNHLQ